MHMGGPPTEELDERNAAPVESPAVRRLSMLVESLPLRDDPDALMMNVRVWVDDLKEVLRLAQVASSRGKGG